MLYLVNKHTKEHRRYADAPDWPDADCIVVAGDPDGWIEWQGGECPLPDGAKFEAMLRDGRIVRNVKRWDKRHRFYAPCCSDIIAYRSILNADTNPDTTWNGEGLPPVGCECEVNHLGEWRQTIIVGEDDSLPVFKTDWADRYAYACGSDFKFRPIRRDEDRTVEEMVRDLADNGCEGFTMKHIARMLYRAGYRKEDN